ncbi:MAG: hypothetical protein KJ847_03950, partial [Firmicutes bacterium]|nr:hypothetical protein [Bacillota bacterium]
GELETINDIYYIDDVYIVQTEQTIDQDFSYAFSAIYFTTLDLDFNVIDDLKITSMVSEILCTDKYLFIKYLQSNEYDLAVRTDLSFFSKDEVLGVENNMLYSNEFYLEFINEAMLNDEVVENGVLIDYPGNYRFIHNNRTYVFTLMANIFGVENNQIYTQSVTPIIDKGNILLNNDLFVSGTALSKPGNYELVTMGVGDYSESINFTITHQLNGIINNQTYTENVVLTFTGDGYLNNQYIQSPYEVSAKGDYLLKIKGENNYLETYYFQIEEDSDQVTIVDFIQKFDIFILVVVVISGIIVLKKK